MVADSARVRRSEVITAVVLLALSALALAGARAVEITAQSVWPTARWWPTVLSVLALALSAVLLVVSIVRSPTSDPDLEPINHTGLRRALATVALCVLFVLAWRYAYSFLVPCALLMAALLWVHGCRRWKPLVIFPLAMTVGIFVIFQLLLQVPL